MALKEYKKKRDFKKTPEPGPETHKGTGPLKFVVQRHQASHLHYDLRLEMKGVLKSWAVPKGPSLDPGIKRLAMETEDHPYEYLTFHGVIPEGNYGAGIMEIWDSGSLFSSETKNRAESERQLYSGYYKGHISFELRGKKLKGIFDLIKTPEKGENAWLLAKRDDKFSVKGYNAEEHVLSEKESDGGETGIVIPKSAKKVNKFPGFLSPMLAKLIDKPFSDENWVFELKWDGYRAISTLHRGKVNLFSRNGNIFMKYSEVNEELETFEFDAILDGEVVIMDENGRSSFQLLQNFDSNPNLPLYYYVFDVLYYEGYSLVDVPLIERKKLLKQILPASNIVLYSDDFIGVGEKVFDFARKNGLEGIIGKEKDSKYIVGKRTSSWVKIKTQQTQEGIIVGFNAPQGSRAYFGSLVLAAHRNGKLEFIGSSGGGFSESMLKTIHKKLQPLLTDKPAISKKFPAREQVQWVEPELVCEVAFSEWTNEGTMRHPVFKGLRPDKSPDEVVIESPEHMKEVVPKIEKELKKAAAKEDLKTSKKPSKKSTKELHLKKDAKEQIVNIDGIDITFTNLDKKWWPEDGFTKKDLLEYYWSVAKYILPYLKDRPQSQNRYPNGIHAQSFYKKDMGKDAPDWAETFLVHRESTEGQINYILCQDRPTLMYLAQIGCIEINPWNSRVQAMENPDWIVIDIDPSDGNTFDQVIDVALATKEVLDKAEIKGYPKTSGSSGIHIYIPLGAKYNYEQARIFANLIADNVYDLLPDITTLERMVNKRGTKIYIDYLQNSRGQTLATVYSARPKPGATVSTPLEWKEVKQGLHPSKFHIKNTLERIEKKGDLFKGVLGPGIDMKKVLKNLGYDI